MAWSETTMYTIGKGLFHSVQESDAFTIATVVQNTEALHEIALELQRRIEP